MERRILHREEPVVEVGPIARFYRHGWHSWSPTGWVDPSIEIRPIPDEGRRLGHDDPVHALETTVSGSCVGVAEGTDGVFTLLGSLSPGARVRPDASALRGAADAGVVDWLVARGTMNEVFDAYVDELTARLGRRGRGRVRVWCSWYSYYEGVTEEAIHRTIGAARSYPFDVIQVDDGWEAGIGDWHANDDFPRGMGHVADVIRSNGFDAGIWVAPLIASEGSRLAAERPELLLRDETGAPVVSGINWGGPYYSLDPTSEATAEFLTDLITTLRSWGFGYLKLDFLYAGAFPGVFATPMPRELAYRRAMGVIREAAGDDCYLLACGAPVIASTGIVDGMRIGPDVAEFWEDDYLTAIGDASGRGARNAIATSSARLWMRDLFDADPDVVYVDRSAVDLDDHTLGSLMDLARVTGFTGTSDRLEDLEPDEASRLRSLLSDEPVIARGPNMEWSIDGRDVGFPSSPASSVDEPRSHDGAQEVPQ